jgi:putative ABC transport system permease protein
MAEARCDPIPTARIHQKLYGWLMFGRYRGRSRRNSIDGRHFSRHFTQHTLSLSSPHADTPTTLAPLLRDQCMRIASQSSKRPGAGALVLVGCRPEAMIAVSRASFAEGLSAMAVNPLRTALSTLGVVMGIGSVIATLALADGFEGYLRDRIATQTDAQSIAISSRTQNIRDGFAFPNNGYPVFGLRDAADLQAALGATADVTMSVAGSTIVDGPREAAHAASATATLANFLLFGRRDVYAGRYFTDAEVSHNTQVVVLSYKLAAELSPTGDPSVMVGREVRVRGRTMTAIGVMPSYAGEATFGIFVPLRQASSAIGVHDGLVPSLAVRAPSLESVDATKGQVIDWLARRYHDWSTRVTVTTSLAQLEQLSAAMRVLKLVLGAFAGIALAVGGVGIMNVLLAGVAERTREIGVRKALGARRRDIMWQFLTESIAIASLGSGLGTLFGFTGAFSLAALVRWRVPGAQLWAAVTWPTVVTSIGSAVGVGVVFGMVPAIRAARLSPIDAIRHE